MIRLTWWESIVTGIIQFVLYLAYPWQTDTRMDTVLCLIVLGIVAVVLLGMAEWTAEHIFNVKIPG